MSRSEKRQWTRPEPIVLFWAMAAAAALMVIGAFGPWAKLLGLEVSGTDGSNDGWLIVGAAVLTAALLWLYYATGSVLARIGILALSSVSLVICEYDREHISSVGAITGWGVLLSLIGSIALASMTLAFMIPMRMRASRLVTAEGPVAATRLDSLSQLRERGLITEAEFESKRSEILGSL